MDQSVFIKVNNDLPTPSFSTINNCDGDTVQFSASSGLLTPNVSWEWSFGDNTMPNYTEAPYHTYPDSIAVYQISLIITDNMGCTDTAYKHISISDDYWIYLPIPLPLI